MNDLLRERLLSDLHKDLLLLVKLNSDAIVSGQVDINSNQDAKWCGQISAANALLDVIVPEIKRGT